MHDPTVAISDAADIRVDDYRFLNDQAVRRRMEGDEYFIAEGYVSIDRLVESGHRLRSVLLSPSRVDRFRPHFDHLNEHGVSVFVAERPVMAQIVGFDLHRGVLASATRKPLPTVAELAETTTRLVVLENLNDGENVGAIARAARAFGVDGILLSPGGTDPYVRRTVRVSMGEVLHMPVARADAEDWPNALDTLHAHGFDTWAMTPAPDAADLWQIAGQAPERVAVVLGAEGPGLLDATMRATTHRVRIPISNQVDSLNVGHAAAVTFAAIARP